MNNNRASAHFTTIEKCQQQYSEAAYYNPQNHQQQPTAAATNFTIVRTGDAPCCVSSSLDCCNHLSFHFLAAASSHAGARCGGGGVRHRDPIYGRLDERARICLACVFDCQLALRGNQEWGGAYLRGAAGDEQPHPSTASEAQLHPYRPCTRNFCGWACIAVTDRIASVIFRSCGFVIGWWLA